MLPIVDFDSIRLFKVQPSSCVKRILKPSLALENLDVAEKARDAVFYW